jgi:hypothetical protein
MKKSTLYVMVAVLGILMIGWLLFRVINSPVPTPVEDVDFRAWLWSMRGLDLVVQVILVFAGALGIAAILPAEDEDA